MYGSVWKVGELIAGREKDGLFYAVVQVKERVLGPRGAVREPAESATITAPTQIALRRGIRSLGFRVPRGFHVG